MHLEQVSEKKVQRLARTIWTKEEDKQLGKLVKKDAKKDWTAIAIKLGTKCDCTKSGKQCRERYRNYLNPKFEKTEWTIDEKLLFVILHSRHKNHWSLRSKYLNNKSDIDIKNYFYSIIRMSLKVYRNDTTPPSVLKKPYKVFIISYSLELLRHTYLPDISIDFCTMPKYKHKEKIILDLLRQYNVTSASLLTFQQKLIVSFRANHETEPLPIQADINVGKIGGLTKERRLELQSIDLSKEFAFIKKEIILKIASGDISPPMNLNETPSPNIESGSLHESPFTRFNRVPPFNALFPPFQMNPRLPPPFSIPPPLSFPYDPRFVHFFPMPPMMNYGYRRPGM
jgi:hypothetical protein